MLFYWHMFVLLQCTFNWFVYFVLIYNDPDCTFKKSSVVKPDITLLLIILIWTLFFFRFPDDLVCLFVFLCAFSFKIFKFLYSRKSRILRPNHIFFFWNSWKPLWNKSVLSYIRLENLFLDNCRTEFFCVQDVPCSAVYFHQQMAASFIIHPLVFCFL